MGSGGVYTVTPATVKQPVGAV
jgi:hypothetical protein